MIPEQPFEKREHGLTGYASLEFLKNGGFNELAAAIAGYNPDRFDPVALKILAGGSGFTVTLYALDKSAREKNIVPDDKLPVKKFKVEMPWEQLIGHIRQFDLIVSNEAYPISDILVLNK